MYTILGRYAVAASKGTLAWFAEQTAFSILTTTTHFLNSLLTCMGVCLLLTIPTTPTHTTRSPHRHCLLKWP